MAGGSFADDEHHHRTDRCRITGSGAGRDVVGEVGAAHATDGHMVRCIGISESWPKPRRRSSPNSTPSRPFVRGHGPRHRRLPELSPLPPPPGGHDPKDTGPRIGDRLAVARDQLLRPLDYQHRAARKALTGLQPRLLIADAVGLGKTLEVGLILSELIRRGRGEKILVVTPRHILEQFQHELWTRFAIPLVRLDSEGIQRVRRHIPSNRNPFTYYKRSIISIDTLKNAGRYRHHLEGIHWDAVVIDECHNLVNRGTLNNQLARVLAPRTEALLLTSATPHNGDPASFAELINLLDPTAIADPEKIDPDDIAHLYVRRHKTHDEVAAEVAGQWADRKPPNPIMVRATPAENALFAELADTWTHPVEGRAPVSGKAKRLFPWTLFKAALSSHKALAQTVENRRKRLAASTAANDNDGDSNKLPPELQAEDNALTTLADRCAAIDDTSSSKLTALVEQLQEIGVGPRSKTRVVVFSERIATLDWLAATVPEQLGLERDKHVRVLHGGMADVKQMDVIEEFGLAASDVRLLFTGDMASEGVNLHRECNHLIHFDLPWSLITIEQRNGRIDRYGQIERPDVRALLLTPDHPRLTGDIRILTKLLEREHEAHKAFGDSASLLGLHDVDLEEEAIMKRLDEGADPDEAIPSAPAGDSFDLIGFLMGGTGTEPVPMHEPPTLFVDDTAFIDEALRAVFDDPDEALDLRRDSVDPEFYSLKPPRDLANRMRALPQEFLAEQKVAERFRVTADVDAAEQHLQRARESSDSTWPETGFLSPLHPFVEWLVDKVLVSFGRNEAPVLVAGVDAPVFCVQGVYSNGRGQPQLVEWLAITETLGTQVVVDLFEVAARAGIGPTMPNPGAPIDLAPLQARLDAVLTTARAELAERRRNHESELNERLAVPTDRLDAWVKESHQLALLKVENERRRHEKTTREVRDRMERLIESTRITGDPLVRVVAVLVPPAGSSGGGMR